ncbi:MAG: ribose-phosphate pyrophosphokinase [Candidatus Diapherotrites archaeon CG11_big_fil_rev_8_21_14_0_20_37_9]|nr:MAG: ribose-phosphate pyrophosphokinase [Candidatus Diapherotrites archaeon CG11_big_fil_rev_8_21_14_0_20_37_9]
MKKLAFFAGNSNPELAKEMAEHLKIKLGKIELKKFADGETYANYLESVRGKEVYLLQSTCDPVNDNLMELLIMIDAAKRAAAEKITCIIPYFGYAKQDRKANDREPITAKLVAKLLDAAGADAVIIMDLHSDQVQGFFDINADFLYASGSLVKHFLKKGLKNLVVVSPDVGSSRRARAFAKRLGASLAIVDKRRPRPNVSEVMHLIGEVEGKIAIIVDDEINTAGTICNAADAVMERGAKEVYAMASHAVFAGSAIERLKASKFKEIIVTNSIPQKEKISKVKVVSVASLLAEAIKCCNENKSLSKLLNPVK